MLNSLSSKYLKGTKFKMSVQLIIKSAAQNVEDFKLDCENTWTIAQVKDQLTALYPTKPAREHQKLIYGGKLLPDHLPLTSILNPTQEVHILHLVCPFPLKSESQKSGTFKEKTVPPSCTIPPLNTNGIYPPVNQQLQTSSVFTSSTPPVGTFALNTPTDVVHQYLAMQQMYTQFMTQYMSQYNGVNVYGQVPVTTPPVQQPAPPAPQPNVNQNAEARPGAEAGWDLIDLLYLISRATMLFAILIYYSSPSRVTTVCILVLLLSLFAKYNRERQQEQLQRENERQQELQRATERQSAETPLTEAEAETTDNTETVNENASVEASPPSSPPQNTYMQTALSVPSTIIAVVTSFFTSLIPVDPVPVNVN